MNVQSQNIFIDHQCVCNVYAFRIIRKISIVETIYSIEIILLQLIEIKNKIYFELCTNVI